MLLLSLWSPGASEGAEPRTIGNVHRADRGSILGLPVCLADSRPGLSSPSEQCLQDEEIAGVLGVSWLTGGLLATLSLYSVPFTSADRRDSGWLPSCFLVRADDV